MNRNENREILLAGFGGQGVLTAGLVISQIALYAKYNATWLPSYGAAMRGGTANCTVHYGKDTIYNPGQQKPDILLAMNEPSFKKFGSAVKEDGIILVNGDMVSADSAVENNARIVQVPCVTLADRVQNPKGANIVMIGAIVKLLGDFDCDTGICGMNDMFRKKGKDKFEKLNEEAFRAGYEYV